MLRINRVRRVAPKGRHLIPVANRYGMALSIPVAFARPLAYAKVYQDRAGAFWYRDVLGHQKLLKDVVGEFEILPAKAQ